MYGSVVRVALFNRWREQRVYCVGCYGFVVFSKKCDGTYGRRGRMHSNFNFALRSIFRQIVPWIVPEVDIGSVKQKTRHTHTSFTTKQVLAPVRRIHDQQVTNSTAE
jgi:hypothetical protein